MRNGVTKGNGRKNKERLTILGLRNDMTETPKAPDIFADKSNRLIFKLTSKAAEGFISGMSKTVGGNRKDYRNEKKREKVPCSGNSLKQGDGGKWPSY